MTESKEQKPEFIAHHYNNTPTREQRSISCRGIKFFNGTSLPPLIEVIKKFRQVTAEQLREDRKVWRPEEVLEAAEPFFEQGKVIIVGDPQSGKGTILFGLSEICDIWSWGYVFIDGHHQETDAQTIVDVFNSADTRRIPIFFDSFDYLFLKGRSRAMSVSKQRERTTKIMEAVDKITTPISITTHDESWAQEFLDLQLRDNFSETLSKFQSYEIPLNFRSAPSIRRFLLDHDFTPEKAEFLVSMSKKPWVVNNLTLAFGDQGKVNEVFEALQNYPVLKELTRDRKNEVDDALVQMETGDVQGLTKLAQIIRESEHKRRLLTLLRKR